MTSSRETMARGKRKNGPANRAYFSRSAVLPVPSIMSMRLSLSAASTFPKFRESPWGSNLKARPVMAETMRKKSWNTPW